jgi:hypothetical protein
MTVLLAWLGGDFANCLRNAKTGVNREFGSRSMAIKKPVTAAEIRTLQPRGSQHQDESVRAGILRGKWVAPIDGALPDREGGWSRQQTYIRQY